MRKLDGHTAFHNFATGTTPAMEAKSAGAGSQYAGAAKDSQGNWLEGDKTCNLTLPPKIPYGDFWSVTVYDTQTPSLLQTDYPYPAIGAGAGFPKEGTYYGPVKQNADSSTDIYLGPQAPEGKKSNWVLATTPRAGAGSSLCDSTARWNPGSTRLGGRERSNWWNERLAPIDQ